MQNRNKKGADLFIVFCATKIERNTNN